MATDRDRRTIDAHLPLRPVEFHILLSLAAGERHGYGIIQDIQERGDASVPDVGTMYRALARMVEAGLIEAGARRPAPDAERRAAQLLPHHGGGPARRDRGGAAAGSADAGGAHRRPAPEGAKSDRDRLVNLSERWFRLLLRLYPPDFRDEMGDAVVETYRDRAREALRRGGVARGSPACGCARSSTRCATVRASGCGPRSRGGAAATGAATRSWRCAGCCAPGVRRGHDRHADARTRHGRRRLHRRPEDPDRADAVPESRRPLLRLARLRTDPRPEARRARRDRHRGAAEAERRDRGRRGAPAVSRRRSSRCARAATRARSR